MMDSMFPIALVIDTNSLIHRLSFLKSLVNIKPPNLELYLPFVVIDELDGLKNNGAVQAQARAASNYVLGLVSNGTMRGQLVSERGDIYGLSNDDQILEFAIFISKKLTPNVLLLSNDRNLAIKASIHGIIAFSNFSGSAKEFLQKLESDEYETYFNASTQHENSPSHFGINEAIPLAIQDTEMVDESFQLVEILQNLYDVLVGCLTASLQILLTAEIDLLPEQPWDLQDVISIIRNRNWGIQIDKSLFTMIKDLNRSVRRKSSMMTVGDTKLLIHQIKPVLKICEMANLPQDAQRANFMLDELHCKLLNAI